jgi:hypothetical protein
MKDLKMRQAVDCLISGDFASARAHISVYPKPYRDRLLDEDNNLTRAGLEWSIGYPLDSEAREGLENALPTSTLPARVSDRAWHVLEILKLIGHAGELTEFGRIRAIEGLPLTAQCKLLGLGLGQLSLPHGESNTVEFDGLTHFESQGWVGLNYEGHPICLLLKALCHEVLMSFRRESRVGFEPSPHVFLQASLVQWPDCETTPESRRFRLIDALRTAGPGELRHGFRTFFPGSGYERLAPRLSESFLMELFESLTKEQLLGLATFVMENPYGHCNGWPDLTLIRESSLKLAEIKTRDRLHFSQIRTFPRLRAAIPDIQVLQITRVR